MTRLLQAGAVFLGLVLVLVATLAAVGLDVPTSLQALWEGGLKDKSDVARTLVRTCPLLLCGLGLTIAWRAGMYNIGGEGQFLMGGMGGAAAFAIAQPLGPYATLPVILAASVIGGSLIAWLAGWLQAARGVQVVISTILLNVIALQFLKWGVNGPLQEPNGAVPLSERLPREYMLRQFDPQTDLHLGVFIAFLLAAVVWFYLFRTKAGFKLRVTGQNPRAAQANRIPAERVQVGAMVLSGALCGLAGGIEYTGLVGQVGEGFSSNWGFLAIPVALLGGLNPLGVAAASLYFGFLLAGSENLERTSPIGSSVVLVIQAVAVLGFVGLGYWYRQRQMKAQEVDGD